MITANLATFTHDEVNEMLRFMFYVNQGWDSDRPARRNLTLLVNKLASAYDGLQTVEVPDEGYA